MRPIDADVLKVTKIVERKRKLFADGRVRKANEWTDVVLLEDIENAPTIEYGTWIPVTERLPEDSRDVILTTRSLVVGVGCVIARDGKWAQWYSGGGILVDVIAWMSLPSPYREEKKDE